MCFANMVPSHEINQNNTLKKVFKNYWRSFLIFTDHYRPDDYHLIILNVAVHPAIFSIRPAKY
jgi:hypothetical protein